MTSSNQLNNVTTAAIRAELDQIVKDTAEWMERASVLLVELRRRGEDHPLMHSNVLRAFKGIAERKLSAEAVLAVGGNANIVRALEKLPLDQQAGYAKDCPVPVVEVSPEGKHVTAYRKLQSLGPSVIDRVFGPDGLRSIEEQKAMLAAPSNRIRVDGILIDTSERRIIIARKHISPADLIGPLKALGYELRRVGG